MVYPEYGAVPAHIPRFVCGREAALCIAGIGLTFLTFPYGTPETNSRGGVRRGILYVRSASAAMIAAALVLSYLFSI